MRPSWSAWCPDHQPLPLAPWYCVSLQLQLVIRAHHPARPQAPASGKWKSGVWAQSLRGAPRLLTLLALGLTVQVPGVWTGETPCPFSSTELSDKLGDHRWSPAFPLEWDFCHVPQSGCDESPDVKHTQQACSTHVTYHFRSTTPHPHSFSPSDSFVHKSVRTN